MSTEQNKALVRQPVKEVFNQGKLETADEIADPTLRVKGRQLLIRGQPDRQKHVNTSGTLLGSTSA